MHQNNILPVNSSICEIKYSCQPWDAGDQYSPEVADVLTSGIHYAKWHRLSTVYYVTPNSHYAKMPYVCRGSLNTAGGTVLWYTPKKPPLYTEIHLITLVLIIRVLCPGSI